jgi:molecular chaperone DnaJ
MPDKRDYYEVLGVERTASDQEIADAYRKLAIANHPDKNPGDEEAVARFKESAEAFEVLHDSEKRARYDRFGHAGVNGGAGGGSQFHDISDIFEAFGDIFGGGGGVFGDLFGGGGRGRRRVRKGADVHCEVTIDLLKAARGVSLPIEFPRHKKCTACNATGAKDGTALVECDYCGGRGQVIQSSGILRVQTACPSCGGKGRVIRQNCASCRGEGYIQEHVEQEITIPAGIDDQMQIRVSGQGEPSPNGGPPGDCYCHIHVQPHSLFHRDGNDLIIPVPITYSQAALGATIEVPTLDGIEDMDIPAGTQPGEVFTLRRKGMPDPRGGRVGDLKIHVRIEVPRKLDERQEELLRELAEAEHINVSPHRKSFLEKLRGYFVPSEDE